MLTFYRFPKDYSNDLEAFGPAQAEFRAGNIDPIRFRAIRVGYGIYEQRKDDTYMVRIRCAGAGITPRQLAHAAQVSSRYAAGFLHVTTRFEMQMHNVAFDDLLPVMRKLTEVGLSTRGGGGNTIRNITAATDSGVEKGEVFDVTPYAMALTTRMIEEKDSFNLPRKFKIAFSNTEKDTAIGSLMDLGFIAQIREGQPGFRVFVAGGMGAKSMAGKLLEEFIPADQVYATTKALKLMYDQHGNRKNKFINRIRFLWEKLGEEKFRAFYQEQLARVLKDSPPPLELPELVNEGLEPGIPVEPPEGEGFVIWKTRYVKEQKQAGLVTIQVPLFLGDINNQDALALARLLEPFGENVLRFSKSQNIHIRNIPSAYLGNIYNGISRMKTLSTRPRMVGNMIACTGAATCKLGICLPRGVMTGIENRLAESTLGLDRLEGFKLNISGCPNSCGQHSAGDLGFFGKVNRVDGRMMPAYNILAGAEVSGKGSRLAEKVASVAAKDLPDLVHDALGHWLNNLEKHPTYLEYLNNGGKEEIKRLAEKYNQRQPTYAGNPAYYTDWGTEAPFSIANRGMGECSAGLFDLIDADVKTIKTNRNFLLERIEYPDQVWTEKMLSTVKRMMKAAARMLLITRGLEPVTDQQIYGDFQKHFIDASLVPAKFSSLVEWAGQSDYDRILANNLQLAELCDWMINLYNEMDPSLKFPAEKMLANQDLSLSA